LKLVGLISDTHVPTRAKSIPAKVFDVFKEASLIVHAGDLVECRVIRELEHLAPVVAVQGNMDTAEVKAKLPTISYAQVDNSRIGVVHNLGFFNTLQNMQRTAKNQELSVLVSGHLHRPSLKWQDKILLVNPGSPTNPIPPFVIKPTVALLKIFSDHVEPEIVQI
jgi:putative phosphoesterase